MTSCCCRWTQPATITSSSCQGCRIRFMVPSIAMMPAKTAVCVVIAALNELFKTLRFGNHAGGDSEVEDAGYAAGLGRQFQTQRLDVGCGGLKDQHVLYVF